jgi:hypothetical protein
MLLVLPLEVVPPIAVAVKSLTRLSPVESGVRQLVIDLELEVSEALGESLSEVCAQYFGDSNMGERDWDLAEESDHH